jgi:acyl-CoA synthetase (NDP forming)
VTLSASPLESLLQPRSIAVFGASEHSRPDFIYGLQDLGFKGDVYIVNPRYPEIHGIKAYPSVNDIPGPVDYAISAIPAPAVPGMMDDCGKKGVKLAHIYSARFGETGRPQDAELEREVLRRARKAGVRIIGPNCMGLYYPKMGIGWDNFPRESGPVALASQSSYAAHDFIFMATPRGIRFSKVVGYGNALDFNECDFVEYFTEDPETKVILMYIEGVKDGKRFMRALRKASSVKPVILIKGGQGEAGTKAVASHTASIAGSIRTWNAAVRQAGAIPADSLEEMLDLAVSFSLIKGLAGNRVGIAGSGGGPSVLAADQCEAAGLRVVPMPDEIRADLKNRNLPIWDWIGNPVDMTMTGGAVSASQMLNMMAKNSNFDLLIAIMGEPHYQKRGTFGSDASAFLQRYSLDDIKEKPVLAVIPDKSLDSDQYGTPVTKMMCEIRTKLVAGGVPVYPSMARAAKSARTVIDYYRARESKS